MNIPRTLLRRIGLGWVMALALIQALPLWAATGSRNTANVDDIHQVCTALGLRWVDSQGDAVSDPIGGDAPTAAEGLHPGGEHCASCLLGLQGTALFGTHPLLRTADPWQHGLGPPGPVGLPSSPAWLHRPSRAPPGTC